jgi:hypothetical protein
MWDTQEENEIQLNTSFEPQVVECTDMLTQPMWGL